MTSSMVNIKKLVIDNFQSHEHTELEFSYGFNIIFGPSDFGKSAIIRAVKWVLYNEPRGTDFIRHGTTTARVAIEFSNGNTIVRERSQSKNRYILIYPDGRNMTFEGFGNEIPAEIVKAHGIPKVALDNDSSASLNIGEQLEGPFLLSETGAVRAKAIGRLIGLHIIDKAIRNCNLDLRRENQSEEKVRKDLGEVETSLEEYKNLKIIEEKLNESEIVINKTENLILKNNRLEAVKKEYESIDNEYEGTKRKYDRLKKLKECEIDLKNCEINQQGLERLIRIEKASREIETEILRFSKVMERSSGLEECTDILNLVKGKKESLEKLGTLRDTIVKIDREIQNAGKQIENTRNVPEFEELLKIFTKRAAGIEKMASVSERLNEVMGTVSELENVLCYSGKIDMCGGIIEEVNKRIELLKKIEGAKEQLVTVENYIIEGKKYIESNQKETEKYASKYMEALREAGKCPLCGSRISEDILGEIIKHYEEA